MSQNYTNVGVNDPCCIQIDYPTHLHELVSSTLDEFNLQGNAYFNETGVLWELPEGYTIEQAGLEIVEGNCVNLQDALVQLQLPFTFYVSNDSEHWERMDCRWIDGEYVIHTTTAYNESIDTHEVLRCLDAQALTALTLKVKAHIDSVRDRDFTQEDFDKAQVLRLKHMVVSS